MKVPEIPSDEETRLKSLRALNILDTPQEERFDRMTRMARRMFGVSIALVSLVDENRQWFKSCEGLSVRETPRDISFCGHAILGGNTFVIPDTSEDDRFKDNPLVLNEPLIRFYAGCPLRALDGSKLGTLCIIDQAPKEFSTEDIEALEDLASMVERELAAVELATIDELTNISNRRGFLMFAEHSLNLCVRQDIPASLIFLDIDGFKPINDQFGHAEGDRALIAFADQMKCGLRDSDFFARLGGDEFVVLLTNSTAQVAESAIQRLQDLLDAYNKESNNGYEISFSHGTVDFDPDKHNTVEALLDESDRKMYHRKRLGKAANG